MAERNEKTYERVVQELEKDPTLGSKELYATLQRSDKAVGKDTLRQFHARYYMAAKRARKEAAGEKPARRGGQGRRKGTRESAAPAAEPKPGAKARRGRKGEPDRDRVRSLLLQFAQDLTDAESRSNLVQVLSRVDSYVDKIAAAV